MAVATEPERVALVTAPQGQGAALALAAVRTRLLCEQLEEADRAEPLAAWGDLIERLDQEPRRAAFLIAGYRGRIEARLSAARRAATR